MTSQGSPHARLRRAIATGNAHLAWVAATELEHVDLQDALALVCSSSTTAYGARAGAP